ncbi:endonuclease VII domain-containing protein [Streptomyces lasiicapitis]|uniref:endonuclease VII domain-containing protein n=1 Tax=Streptomyces lasiicapitis TaxID=1923961 RepID=UPI0036550CCF
MSHRTCGVHGCARPHTARDYCDFHYREWKRCGVAGSVPPTSTTGACSFRGCDRRRRTHGLCTAHYLQKFKGEELRPLRIRIDTTARDEQGRKQCSRCRDWKPDSDYYANPRIKGGLHSFCMRCWRSDVLKRAYGITLDQYEAMLTKQGGGCAICGGTNANGRNLYVDHDHACCPGAKSCGLCVRALLCDPCNRSIGLMRDDPMRLEAAASYLRRYARA